MAARDGSGEPLLDRVVGAVYEAAVDEAAWPSALSLVGDLFAGTGGHFLVWDRRAGASPFSTAGDRMTPEGQAEYAAYYARIDPRLDVVLGLPTGAATACHEHFDDDFVSRSEFYNDYLLRHGRRYLAACRLAEANGEVAILGVHRGPRDEPFGADELALLARLGPRLGHAARVERELRRARGEAALTRAALDRLSTPVLVVDAGGRVLASNRAAEAATDAGDPVRLRGGRLGAREPDEEARLLRVVKEAAGRPRRGGAARLSRTDGRALVALAAPLAPGSPLGGPGAAAALVVVSDPSAADWSGLARELCCVFGLTAAEARLAAAIAEGSTLKEAATRFRVGHETVRTQLRAVLAKTGTRRQAELVGLVAALPKLRSPARDG
jgi:DNA-binding CsgD family transcriptional regulator/PAS domain-containing protein